MFDSTLLLGNQSDYKKIISEHISFTSTPNLDEGGYEELKQQSQQNEYYRSFTIAKNSSSPYYRNQIDIMNSKCHYDLKTNVTKFKEISILKNGFLYNSTEQRKNFSEFLIEDLKSDSQILFIFSKLQQPGFPNMYKPIPYAEHIMYEASKIINQLDLSYIAIHWRMEQAVPKNLPNCARELVKTIQKIKENTGINNVYLTTYFPLTYNRNGSIKKKNKENLLFNELKGPGVQGILDINSNYFLSGPRDCCRTISIFTKQIANSRKQLLDEGNITY
ncbi:13584_t:CDS:2 [Entrophospora sp. SA101]|nr:13584_t:CDS:2 [Entrophospora sp. SA101]